MGTWSVEPSQGVIIGADGNITFPENDGNEEKTYTVTYTENGVTCYKTVVQQGKGCLFEYTQTTNQIPREGQSDFVFGHINSIQMQVSDIGIVITEGADCLDGTLRFNANRDLIGNVLQNQTQSSRTIKYQLKSKTDVECFSGQTTQSKGCDCTNFSISNTTIGKDNTTFSMSYAADSCITNITASVEGTANWITSIGVNTSNHTVTGTVNTFTETGQRTATIKLQGKAGTATCTKNATLTQTGVECACSSLTDYDMGKNDFNLDSQSNVLLGTVKVTTACKGSLRLDSLSEGLSVNFGTERTSGNYTYVQVIGNIGESTYSRILEYQIYIDGCSPSIYRVYQQCWKGTDNGTEVYLNTVTHDYEKFNYDIYMCPGIYVDSDSILVENLTVDHVSYYDGTTDPSNPSSYVTVPYNETGLINNNIIGSTDYKGLVKIGGNDEFEVTWENRGLCNEGMIHFSARTQFNGSTYNFRSFKLHLKTTNTKLLSCQGYRVWAINSPTDVIGIWSSNISNYNDTSSGDNHFGNCPIYETEEEALQHTSEHCGTYVDEPNRWYVAGKTSLTIEPTHHGESCCSEWELEIRQCPAGYKWYSRYESFDNPGSGKGERIDCRSFRSQAEATAAGYPYLAKGCE